ncbi:TBC1 domain family member 5 [Chironomus tepperi]|uniref:TBC1 domain family member 5 n=1 Tax=Chironomus tepperi TaxID=113505 RepID=UPI00391FAE8F
MDLNSWEIVESSNNDENIQNDNNLSDDNKDDNHISHLHRSSSRYGQNVKNYETEWRDLCMMIATEPDLKKLRTISISGDLKVSKFRSVIWNVLLGGLSNDPQNWIEERKEQRNKYRDLKKKFILDPASLRVVEEKDNPLSQSKDSLWNQHFCDTELRNVIHQDVVRTNPNVDYYRTESVQEVMINILFCYARQYPLICYRQGMHEILAPLIFVMHCDHQSLGHIQEETTINLDPILLTVLDPGHIEEDSYHLFSHLMNSLELFYRVNDMTISESGQLSNIPKEDSPKKDPKKSSEIEVVHQLNMVRDKIFAKYDLHLHNHFLKLEIPLALFGIRWLRLLFGREFNLLDLLILWDAIFGIGDNLKFTYYIVVAMLTHIRDKLLTNDYTTCLTILMRYPSNADVSLIIRHALYMCEPDKYECPPKAFVYLVNNLKQRPTGIPRGYQQPSTMSRASMPKMPSPRKLSDDVRREAAKSNRKSQNDDGVVDGYSLDDPEILKMELQDSYGIMSVSRIKLLQYLSILRKYIPGNQIDELHQTLDGIEELCSLLKPKYQYLMDECGPIETACEADDDEDDVLNVPSTSSTTTKKLSHNPYYELPSNRVTKLASQLLQKNRREVEMEVIKPVVGRTENLGQIPQKNPVGDRRNSD